MTVKLCPESILDLEETQKIPEPNHSLEPSSDQADKGALAGLQISERRIHLLL